MPQPAIPCINCQHSDQNHRHYYDKASETFFSECLIEGCGCPKMEREPPRA